MRLVAIDPGDTTGWAQFDTTSLHDPPILSQVGETGELLPLRNIIVGSDLVVVERFQLLSGLALAQIGSQFRAAQVIGAVSLICQESGIPCHLVPPQSHTKSFFSDRRLKELGYVTTPTTHRHSSDAVRLGLQYLHFTLEIPYH